jgi:hypothetical protein
MQVVRKYYAGSIEPNALSLIRQGEAMTRPSPGSFVVAFVLATAVVALGCSSNNGGSGATFPSGEVIGPPDTHCSDGDGGLMVQTIGVCQVDDPTLVPSDQSACDVTFDQDAGTGAATDAAASTGADAAVPVSDYGPTMYGSAGNDDDCKYYVSWISTPIQEKVDTYFTVTVRRLEDMKAATCAGVIPDVSLVPPDGGFSTHGVPPPAHPSTEISSGVYKVGPIPFDVPGVWTVRFHFYEECNDTEDSPHGHAAFFVNVP